MSYWKEVIPDDEYDADIGETTFKDSVKMDPNYKKQRKTYLKSAHTLAKDDISKKKKTEDVGTEITPEIESTMTKLLTPNEGKKHFKNWGAYSKNRKTRISSCLFARDDSDMVIPAGVQVNRGGKLIPSKEYGQVKVGNKFMNIHRITASRRDHSLNIKYENPSGKEVLSSANHICDNKGCFNPHHSVFATRSDNNVKSKQIVSAQKKSGTYVGYPMNSLLTNTPENIDKMSTYLAFKNRDHFNTSSSRSKINPTGKKAGSSLPYSPSMLAMEFGLDPKNHPVITNIADPTLQQLKSGVGGADPNFVESSLSLPINRFLPNGRFNFTKKGKGFTVNVDLGNEKLSYDRSIWTDNTKRGDIVNKIDDYMQNQSVSSTSDSELESDLESDLDSLSEIGSSDEEIIDDEDEEIIDDDLTPAPAPDPAPVPAPAPAPKRRSNQTVNQLTNQSKVRLSLNKRK
jgi:hypothetical protein